VPLWCSSRCCCGIVVGAVVGAKVGAVVGALVGDVSIVKNKVSPSM
jgi:uncharacterized membrane protein